MRLATLTIIIKYQCQVLISSISMKCQYQVSISSIYINYHYRLSVLTIIIIYMISISYTNNSTKCLYQISISIPTSNINIKYLYLQKYQYHQQHKIPINNNQPTLVSKSCLCNHLLKNRWDKPNPWQASPKSWRLKKGYCKIEILPLQCSGS